MVISLPQPTPAVASHLKKVFFKSMGPNRFPHPPHTLLLYISSSPLPISPRVPVHWPTSLTHWPICLDLHTETYTITSLCYLKCISLYIVCLEALENPSSHCPKRRQWKHTGWSPRPMHSDLDHTWHYNTKLIYAWRWLWSWFLNWLLNHQYVCYEHLGVFWDHTESSGRSSCFSARGTPI